VISGVPEKEYSLGHYNIIDSEEKLAEVVEKLEV
jgi:hypothetical protein